MSITFGIYDFFSYTVPGVIYILVVNRLLSFLNLPHVDISSLNVDVGKALLWVVIAYVVGQLMDFFSIKLYYKVNGFNAEIEAIKKFKDRYEDLGINFTIHDRKTIFSVIRHNNLDLALYIDSFKAMSFMLNSVSLALLLLAMEQLVEILVGGFSFFALAIIIASLGFSWVAIKKSATFNKWHWEAVYHHGRQYGKSISEMFKIPTKRKSAAKK